jgi:hypothetical protein
VLLHLETWLVGPRRARGKYSTAVSDIAVYGPWIRFIYSAYRLYEMVKNYLVVFFTFWHPGKIATNKIWRYYLHTILGGSYFSIYGEHMSERMVGYAKLSAQLVHLGDLALAYREVRDEYMAYYEEAGNTSVCLHVRQFFEYLLPFVS